MSVQEGQMVTPDGKVSNASAKRPVTRCPVPAVPQGSGPAARDQLARVEPVEQVADRAWVPQGPGRYRGRRDHPLSAQQKPGTISPSIDT